VRIAAAALAVVGAALVIAALATAGGGDEPGPMQAGEPPRGLAVFAEQGCGSCHAFKPANATGTLAPDLTTSLEGRSEEYIRRSIVAPSAEVAPDYGDMMPPDYATRIAPADLDALVAFLAARSRR
jgi:mono/diheme cytochrome c family protein